MKNPFKKEIKENYDDKIEQAFEQTLTRVDNYIVKTLNEVLPDEDYIWKQLNATSRLYSKDLTNRELREERAKAIDLYNIDPSIKQFVNLINGGTFGEGIDMPSSKDSEIQSQIEAVWNDKDNSRILFNPIAMRFMNLKLITDGELFFTLFNDGNTVKLGLLDPNEITQIIVSDNDATLPVLYERTYTNLNYNFKSGSYQNGEQEREYYIDYRADENDETIQRAVAQGNVIDTVRIYHIKVNSVGLRGIPEISVSYDWIRAHARSIADQVTLSKALSMLAWRKTLKTKSSAAITNTANMIQDAVPTTGAVHLSSDAVSLDALNIPTGGVQNLGTAIRSTHIEAIRGLGFGEHYYADNSSGNLATATAMELPAIWKITERQLIWKTIILDIITYSIQQTGYTNEIAIDIEFPNPSKDDASGNASLIDKIVLASEAGYIPHDEAVLQILKLIGSNNISQLLDIAKAEQIEKEDKEEKREQDDLEKQMLANQTNVLPVEQEDTNMKQ